MPRKTQSITETLVNVSASASSVTLAAANGDRSGLTIFNDSSAYLYVKPGSSASTTSFKAKIAPGGYYEWPTSNDRIYKGVVTGIWDSETGSARISEITET